MSNHGKTAASILSAAALVSLSATPLAAIAAPATADSCTAPESISASEGTSAAAEAGQITYVEGTFSFDQDVITKTHEIANIFAKAAATLCQATPGYSASGAADALSVSANGTPVMEATVQELSDDDNAGFVMACACASNTPGGGATANAEVQGVPIAAIAAMLNS